MGAGMNMNITGLNEALKNFNKVPDRVIQALGGGMYLEMGNVMTDSKREVPVDLGALKGSGYVTLPEVKGNQIIVEAGYGGPAKEYAVVQHEHTEYNHPDGGKAKYLQDPMMRHKSSFAKKAVDFARRLFALNAGAPPGTHPINPYQGGE